MHRIRWSNSYEYVVPSTTFHPPLLIGNMIVGEEVRKSAKTIPKVLILTILINGTMAFGFLIALLFSVGDIEAALDSNTGYPIIQIFYQATGSTQGATVMMSAIIIISFASGFGILASVSRLTWAFARDGGLPFSEFFAHVSDHHMHICTSDPSISQVFRDSATRPFAARVSLRVGLRQRQRVVTFSRSAHAFGYLFVPFALWLPSSSFSHSSTSHPRRLSTQFSHYRPLRCTCHTSYPSRFWS